jgi:hypothetical protein
MDTAFSFVLYPEISFTAALRLGEFCSVKETNIACLTRESAVRGFDWGLKADDMLELLDDLSGKRLDPNLGWALKEWEKRYEGVSLNQGVILTLAEDRRYLAEAGPVSSLIKKVIAPGVYLLSCEERTEAAGALKKAGVDIIAQPGSSKDEKDKQPGWQSNSFHRPGLNNEAPALPPVSSSGKEAAAKKTSETPPESAESILEKYRAVLAKMTLTKQERDELAARIERRLVLSEAQLKGASIRYEKLEARGVDYAGKSSIAKQALDTGSLLEVTWAARGEGNRSCTGVPRALEKKGGESILVLRESGDTAQEGTVRITQEKISFIRRIKPSIFGEGVGEPD